jgi:hypothetical protein
VTSSLSDGVSAEKLPLWRLIAGFAVLGTLVALLVTAALVYLDNYRLDSYMRSVAAAPASAPLSDGEITGDILDRAKQLGLSVQSSDVQITRPDGRPHIRIAKYSVQTQIVKMDLRLPEASSR